MDRVKKFKMLIKNFLGESFSKEQTLTISTIDKNVQNALAQLRSSWVYFTYHFT